jgi:hypothetical protein
MNNGRGGFDFATTINLDAQTILKNIQAVLPTDDALSKRHAHASSWKHNSRGRDLNDTTGNERNQHRHVGPPRNTKTLLAS